MTQVLPGHPEAVPGAPTPLDDALSGTSPELPQWAREPVRFLGNLLAGALAVLGVASAVVLAATDVAPASMRDELAAVSGGILVAVAVATRVQAALVRAKVWSPASVATATRTALALPPPGTTVLVPTANGTVSTAAPDDGPPPTHVLDEDGSPLLAAADAPPWVNDG